MLNGYCRECLSFLGREPVNFHELAYQVSCAIAINRERNRATRNGRNFLRNFWRLLGTYSCSLAALALRDKLRTQLTN
jgi:hypothetical protein